MNFREYLNEIETKQRYTFNEDGVYSNIFISEDGEFDSFAKAKKALVKDLRQRMNEFKYALKDLRAVKKENAEGEGDYFTINWDGIYSGIERVSFKAEHKSFMDAKKELSGYLKQRFTDYQYAWKDAVAKKESDVEERTW